MKSDKSPDQESRYMIQGRHVIDTEKVIKSGNPIYIREILDSGSGEYSSSAISNKDRLDIVGNLGLEKLTLVLDECYKSKEGCNYNASNDAIRSMCFILNGSYPGLNFRLAENDSKTKLVVQLTL